MTTSDFNLVTRDTRNNKSEKRRRRHVDQTIQRQEKIAFKAKRHAVMDMMDDDNYNY